MNAMKEVVAQLISQLQVFLSTDCIKSAKMHHDMIVYTEDQYTILQWARDTFGKRSNPMTIALRMNSEVNELLQAIDAGCSPDEIAEECADVVIILNQVCSSVNRDLRWAVDKKMEKNRGRKWKTNSRGVGQHIDEGDS